MKRENRFKKDRKGENRLYMKTNANDQALMQRHPGRSYSL